MSGSKFLNSMEDFEYIQRIVDALAELERRGYRYAPFVIAYPGKPHFRVSPVVHEDDQQRDR